MISLLEKSEIRKQIVPISLKQYHFLIESGLLDKNLELLEGALIEKPSFMQKPIFLSTLLSTALINKLFIILIPMGMSIQKSKEFHFLKKS